jgi:hypothetical protein
MRQCIIHFGMHKTGSTSIQDTLMAASPLSSATYLNIGRGNGSRLVATLFLEDPSEFHLHRKWNLSDEKLAQDKAAALNILDQQFQTGRSPFILSAENISTLDLESLIRLKSWLESKVDDIRLVGYVRPPKSFMASELQQKIKAGREYFKLKRHYPGYETRFGKLETVFGRERVTYWKFDPKTFPGRDVVRDFLQRMSLSVPESALRRTNESLSRDCLSLLYIYRKLGPGYGSGPGSVEQNRRLHHLLREAGGSKLTLSSEAVRPILEKETEDIHWMESRLGESLSEPSVEDSPDAISNEDDLLRPSLDAIRWLARKVDREADLPADGVIAPEIIAEWIDVLKSTPAKRGKLPDVSPLIPEKPAARSKPEAGVLTADELASQSLAGRTFSKATITSEVGVKCAEALLEAIRHELSLDPTRAVNVAGLGHFNPRNFQADEPSASTGWPYAFVAATRSADDPTPGDGDLPAVKHQSPDETGIREDAAE